MSLFCTTLVISHKCNCFDLSCWIICKSSIAVISNPSSGVTLSIAPRVYIMKNKHFLRKLLNKNLSCQHSCISSTRVEMAESLSRLSSMLDGVYFRGIFFSLTKFNKLGTNLGSLRWGGSDDLGHVFDCWLRWDAIIIRLSILGYWLVQPVEVLL